MIPAELAKSFHYYLETGELMGPAAPFLRSIEVDKLPRDNAQITLVLLALADECDHVFRLRHLGAEEVCLVGAIYRRKSATSGPVNVFSGGRGHKFSDAFWGCLGELAERLTVAEWVPQVHDPYVSHVSQVHPAWWRSSASDDDKTASSLVTGWRVSQDGAANFPFVSGRGVSASSTGISFGRTFEVAVEGAVFEAIERNAVTRWWDTGIAAPRPRSECHLELVRVFPPGKDITRHRWLLDLTGPNGVPVIAAISCASNGEGLVVGVSAAKFDVEAARAASLELCQMEAAALIALSKSATNRGYQLNDSEKLWLERWSSAPVVHARPTKEAPIAGERWDGNLLESLQNVYLFDLSSRQGLGHVVQVVLTDVAKTPNQPSELEKEESTQPRFDPSAFPRPI